MILKKNILLILILLISLSSCKRKEIITITDLFDQQEELSYKTLDIRDDSDLLLSPVALELEGKLMIALDVRSPQMFSLIDLITNTIKRSWGRKGTGPGEFVGVLDFYKNYKNTGINAWDPMNQRLNFCSFEQISNKDTVIFIDLFEGMKEIKTRNIFEEFYSNVLQLDETEFLAFGNKDGAKRFTMIDIKNNQKTGTGEFPKQDDHQDVMPIFRDQAYNGCIRYNKKQNKVVYVSYNSEMFEIFNVEDSGLILKYGNYTTIPEYALKDNGQGPNILVEKFSNGKGCYVAMSVTEEKIFILYQRYEEGASDKDIEKLTSRDADEILVFDWDGKPLQMYKLDCMVEEIEYDKNKNRFYAIRSKPDPEIVYFDLQ
ncbi:hypothetical protein FACS189455_2730 [Bacteroidia bacterium]|nr:hypothetical protein FACS189455_2730 [Bacteroidia bacterium]